MGGTCARGHHRRRLKNVLKHDPHEKCYANKQHVAHTLQSFQQQLNPQSREVIFFLHSKMCPLEFRLTT